MPTFEIMLRCHADIGVSPTSASGYVRDELRAAGGQRRPEDPLFNGLRVITIKAVKLNPLTEIAERQVVNIGPLLKFRPAAKNGG